MYTFLFKPGPKKVGFGEQQTRYVARPFYGCKHDEKNILHQIVRNYSGMQRGLVAAALDAVANEFVNFLLTGHAVKLMWVGTFRLSFDCRSQESPEKVTGADISCPRIIFTPDPELKKMMREELSFESVVNNRMRFDTNCRELACDDDEKTEICTERVG